MIVTLVWRNKMIINGRKRAAYTQIMQSLYSNPKKGKD